jgi:hypothetical protein
MHGRTWNLPGRNKNNSETTPFDVSLKASDEVG